MSRAQSFAKSLDVGKQGEDLLLARWGFADAGWRRPTSGERKWDLERPTLVGKGCVVLGGAQTLEVKTDTYDATKTPYFFMEQHTNVAGGPRLVGGPWRARDHGVDVFAYVMLNPTPVAYVFDDIPLLCEVVETLQAGTRRVRHGRLSSTGLLVDREDVLRAAKGSKLT